MEFKKFKEELLLNIEVRGDEKLGDIFTKVDNTKDFKDLIGVIKANAIIRDFITNQMLANLSDTELTVILSNSGKYNTGYYNSGDFNTGFYNSGDCNCGDENTGIRNTGFNNKGDLNSGDFNTGDNNVGCYNIGNNNIGFYNTGKYNTGDNNSGNFNTGDCNSGNFNTGDCNSGDYSTGVFCTEKNPTIKMFNKESNMTLEEWREHDSYKVKRNLELTEWIFVDTLEPAAGGEINQKGFLKEYTYKEAWSNLWRRLTEEEKDSFKTLPNFNSEIFEEITGIKVECGVKEKEEPKCEYCNFDNNLNVADKSFCGDDRLCLDPNVKLVKINGKVVIRAKYYEYYLQSLLDVENPINYCPMCGRKLN